MSIKSILKPYYHELKNRLKFVRRIGLKNKSVSIISNNCGGGFISQYFGLPYNSPTAGLYFESHDYIKFVRDLKHYFSASLEFIDPCESKNRDSFKDTVGWGTYPVARCDDIEIYFMHYPTKEEAAEKWYRRAHRVDLCNVYCILFENDTSTEEVCRAFDKLSLPHKVMTYHDYQGLGHGVYSADVANRENHHWTPDFIMASCDWKKEFNSMAEGAEK